MDSKPTMLDMSLDEVIQQSGKHHRRAPSGGGVRPDSSGRMGRGRPSSAGAERILRGGMKNRGRGRRPSSADTKGAWAHDMYFQSSLDAESQPQAGDEQATADSEDVEMGEGKPLKHSAGSRSDPIEFSRRRNVSSQFVGRQFRDTRQLIGRRGNTFPKQRRRGVPDHPWGPYGNTRPLSADRDAGCFVKVEGLEYSVMKQDLEEAFSVVGEVKQCWVDYDKTDRSRGTGGAIFMSPRDANRAQNMFHGRLLDGSRLHLEVGDPPRRGGGLWRN